MALSDRFRINELVKKGSKAIRRDSKGNILVSKTDKKQTKPKKKKEEPFGSKPIKGKQISPRFKSDLNEVDEPFVQEQTSFDGETSGYIEKPKYNEEELQKAIDVKVDELIKKEKLKKGRFVKEELFINLRNAFDAQTDSIEDLRQRLNNALSRIEGLESENLSLQQQLDAALQQQAVAENQSSVISDRYGALLADFQNSIIKGTKEAIERVSLTAQVRGLQAQKVSLLEQIKLKDRIEEQEEAQQQTAAILASLSGPTNSFEQKGDYAWKIPEDQIEDQAELDGGHTFYFRSNRKSSGWSNGTTLELYNFNEEKEVSYSIDVSVGQTGGHGSTWFALSPASGTIPARSGSTPGKVILNASKTRNVNSPKGRRKVFDDKIALTIDDTSFDMSARFYRKLRKGGRGN